MLVRAATEADVEAIREVGLATWPSTYGFAGADYVAQGLARWWSAEAVCESLRNTENLVAVDDGAVVGVGNLDLRQSPPVLWKLCVRPERHGQGVGRALLTALVRLAGDRPIRLEYLDGNDRAARFYAVHGFREIAREPGERPDWPDTVWVERPADHVAR